MRLFRTPITRPLRWALPLAIGGYLLLMLMPFLVLAATASDCDPIRTTVESTDAGTVVEREVVDADCADDRTRRGLWAFAVFPLFGLTQLPALYFAIRGFLWGADALYELHEHGPGEVSQPRDPAGV